MGSDLIPGFVGGCGVRSQAAFREAFLQRPRLLLVNEQFVLGTHFFEEHGPSGCRQNEQVSVLII